VLVVEDEPRIVEFLVDNLRADDYSVLTAGTAEEAIELLAQSQPDLMLLDVVLPGMGGIDRPAQCPRTPRGRFGVPAPGGRPHGDRTGSLM
jgi:DNA-binding response OmpR family regulator